ncbi:hypothetical protein [Sulfurovum sp.]|uniref:Cas10/Cmr2 second palm domain-containing protein n=1 Tax=Sulfurovum sp. TaxID=1969726 RepID=UPI0025E92476|nr:hypothetical protein [Sulfurovum sp.]
MSRYLYGASVQGIQEFIFKTNKLQEIVGASEIVKSIAADFEKRVEGKAVEVLVNAAGNIKAVFENKAECEAIVRTFAKEIQTKAYGISISQAVVTASDDEQKDINALEQKLKVQRNKVSIPLDATINIMALNPKTAKPLVNKEEDRATAQKREANKAFFENHPNLTEFRELSEMSNGKNKIAVIHADGNGLGELIPTLAKKGKKLSEFSKQLNLATKTAFEKSKDDSMSVRDVILGGDDMMVICNANDALTFTKNFLAHFEEQSETLIGEKLTACAGIAFSNEKYPFHYAVSLAEALCSQTKKHAKKLREDEGLKYVPSSLMFHNIKSANYQSWEKFVEDELTIVNDTQTIRCDFGPYYLEKEGQPNITDFMNTVGAYRCGGSPISRLRVWLGELYNSSDYASNLLHRINEISKQNGEWNTCIMDKNLKNFSKELSNETLIVQKDGEQKTPIYDILQIMSVTEAK